MRDAFHGVMQIAAGPYHALAVDDHGSLYTWGYNNKGQLGNGTTNTSYTPLQHKGITSRC